MSLPVRLALVYGVICTAWVLVTDQILDHAVGLRPELVDDFELVKELMFVCTTAVALFFLLRYESRRRQAREQRLQSSEKQFQDLFLYNPAPMYVVDPVSKMFVDVNEAALTLYGYTRAEFLSMSTFQLRPPEDAALIEETMARIERTWALLGNWRHLRKDGTQMLVEVSSRRIDFNGREALLQVVHDVTAQSKLQRDLESMNRTLQTILNASPMAIYAVDPQFRVTFWSPAAEQLFGWTAEEIIGQELRNIPEEFNDEAWGYRGRLLEGEQLPIIDVERMRKDGSHVWARTATAPTRDSDGQINGIIGIAQDVSAIKEAETALRRLAAIVESSDDSITALTPDGRIASWNAGAERIFGYTADEIIGESFLKLTPTERVEGGLDIFELVKTGIRMEHFDALGLTKDGRVVELSANAFMIGPEGPNANIALVARDVTELKRVDRQNSYQANLLQNVSDAIVAVDTEWRITSWNKAAEALYGWTEAEALGKHPDDFLHTEYINIPHDEAIRQLAETGNWRGEVIEYHKNGTPIHIFNSTSMLRDETGKTIGAVGIEHDITLQRALAEETATRMQLQNKLDRELETRSVRSRFVSMVSHEFRTPLAAIQSSTDLLRHYGPRMSDAQREVHLGVVQKEVESITELLNDFLTISRMETVGIQFDPKPVKLLSLIQETVDTALNSWPDRKVEIQASGDCPPIPLDHKLIRQATLNLLSNAIKYSPQDSKVRVMLSFDHDCAEVAVKDEGIGIPEPDQEHLFEQFYRASNVGSTEGTGLGLAIVRRAVEAHGGTVSVKSSPGSGTTIGFTLPIASGQDT